MRLWALAIAASAVACEIDIDDCASKRSRKSCERAEVDPSGECVWVEVSSHRIVGDACERIESHGECVGIAGTQHGCGMQSCSNGEHVHGYFRVDDEGAVELFENPECGPTPRGDWIDCIAGEVPECACLCS